MPEVVDLTVRNAVATITLNRPDRLNAMNTALLDALLDAVETVCERSDVGALVIVGAGPGFCAGGDLRDLADEVIVNKQARITQLRRHVRTVEMLRESPIVSIAAIHGACAGAGFSLAAACDLRVASATAVFRAAFLSAGMSGDFGLAWSLTRSFGDARARELLLLNEKVTADEARQMGLVTRVLPDDGFHDAVAALAERVAAGAPLARAAIKANINEATGISFSEALSRESARHVGTGTSSDAAEAGRAFLERRTPVFVGQ